MSASILVKGKYFVVKGKELNIGPGLASGYIADSGSWIIGSPALDILGMGFPQEMDPQPISAKLAGFIQQDTAAGRAHLIHHIGVAPVGLVQLWCEGLVTVAHLEKAIETDEYIDVPGVLIGGQEYLVRMYADPEAILGTYTEDGEIV